MLSLLLFTIFLLAGPSASWPIDFEPCSFDADSCQWGPPSASNISFNVWKRVSARDGFRPSTDVTYGNEYGKYMTTESPANINSNAPISASPSILETRFSPGDNVCALGFHYVAKLSSSSGFQLRCLDDGGDDGHVTSLVQIDAVDDWTRRVVRVNASHSNTILQFVYYQTSLEDYAALDSIEFIPCTRCTFERGFCDWVSSEWKLARGGEQFGPLVDVTLNSSSGHFVYAHGGFSNNVASFASRAIAAADNICSIGFSYYALGGRSSVAFETVDGQQLYSEPLRESKMWRFRRFSALKRNDSVLYRYVFYSRYGSVFALDDIEYYPCPNFEGCSFVRGPCEWTQSPIPIQETRYVPWKVNRSGLVAYFPSTISSTQSKQLVGSRLVGACSLAISVEFSNSLYSSFVLVKAHGTRTKITAVNGLYQRKQIALPESARYVSVLAVPWHFEHGSVTIRSLQYLSCLYTSFDVSSPLRWMTHSMTKNHWWIKSHCYDWSGCSHDDHTYGSGKFAEVDFYSPNDVIRLLTNTENSRVCGVRFWLYYTPSSSLSSSSSLDVGVSLRVATSQANASIHIDKSNAWLCREVALSAEGLSPIFEFEASGSQGSSLSIDDITLTGCPDWEVCSFERGLCGWTATAPNDATSWIRWKEKDASSSYRLVLMAPFEGVFKSLPLGPQSEICAVDFYYLFDGSPVTDWLRVVLVRSSIDEEIVWIAEETSGFWRRVRVRVLVNETVSIEFRGKATRSFVVALKRLSYVQCNAIGSTIRTESSATLPIAASMAPTNDSVLPPSDGQRILVFPTSSFRPMSASADHSAAMSATTSESSSSSSSSSVGSTFVNAVAVQENRAQEERNDDGIPVGIIAAGAAVGGTAILIAIVVLLAYCRRKKKSKRCLQSDYVPRDQNIYEEQDIYADPLTTSTTLKNPSVEDEPVYAVPDKSKKKRRRENDIYDTAENTHPSLPRERENVIYDAFSFDADN
ncbi:MAM and LDL-receptor class A domain-containing protein 2-like isoform X2 [Oscarella lobularis]|uniref:MAM and LDL-receptor class A domain-containing protein 2-like isoform X2 n=1 Tax=Oscarella lobularis TaxID=121494 RepID=UPI00331309B3